MPGWRLGWVLIYDKNEAFASEVSELSSNVIICYTIVILFYIGLNIHVIIYRPSASVSLLFAWKVIQELHVRLKLTH